MRYVNVVERFVGKEWLEEEYQRFEKQIAPTLLLVIRRF